MDIVSAVDPYATAQSLDNIEQDFLIDVFGFVAYLLVKLHQSSPRPHSIGFAAGDATLAPEI
jgi:hypothetical protein